MCVCSFISGFLTIFYGSIGRDECPRDDNLYIENGYEKADALF